MQGFSFCTHFYFIIGTPLSKIQKCNLWISDSTHLLIWMLSRTD